MTRKLAVIVTATVFISILGEISSKPSGTYSETHKTFRKFRLKRFVNVPEVWTKFTEGVTGFFDHTVPETLKRFIPQAIQKKYHEFTNRQLNSDKERGQLDFFGREWLKNIGGAIQKTGLNSNTTFFNGRFSLGFMKHIKAIYPGTRFCGDGDVADGKNELGYFMQVDGCCREHDHCDNYIPAGEVRYGLENTGLFTRSHCECDKKFFDCLKRVDNHSIVAKKIGFTYFTVLGPQCFKEDHPVMTCSEHSWGRCTKYGVDKAREKRAQWFDNPTFR